MKNPDNFGYYQVGDLKFYSKLEAIEHHQRSGQHPHWNFNETVFTSVDWTQEPKETLSELYRQRAQQLRDEYDYIVLWYSGGADSENVLSSFIDNNIKLDEVASFVNYEATKEKINFLNAEIYEVAGPRIEQAKQKQTHLQHRLIDLTQITITEFESNSNKYDWIYHFNSIMTVNAVARQRLHHYVDDWRNLFEQGKRVAFVFGVDKPRVHQTEQGDYVFQFLDIHDSYVNAGSQLNNEACYNPEFFYWTPDFPKIVIKQSHIIKNYLKHSTESSPWITETKSDLASKKVNGKTLWLSMDGVHSLIYPKWQPTLYQFKPVSSLFSQRDSWFMNLNNNYNSWQNWQNGLKKRWELVDDYWKNDPTDIVKGYKCSVQRYNIGV